MRVLWIHPGGHPNQFGPIARALEAGHGVESYLLVPWPFVNVCRAHGFRALGCEYDGEVGSATYPFALHYEDIARKGRGVLRALADLRAATGVRFDAIVGHAGFGSTVFAKAAYPEAAVLSYIELPGYYALYCRPEFPPPLDSGLGERAFQGGVVASLLRSELGVVPTRYCRDLFPDALKPLLRVQMEGIDTARRPVPRAEARQKLGLAPDAKLVGFFGRTLVACRGFDVFVRVAKLLLDRDAGVRFVAIGSEDTIYGNEKVHIGQKSFKQWTFEREGIAGERERAFTFKPFLPYDEFRLWQAAVDVTLYPLFEGAGNWGVFEAMACGSVVVASDRAYVPEAIRDGEDGFVVPAEDAAAFADRTARVLADPELGRRLGRAARLTIERRFSVAEAAKGYLGFLEEAIGMARERSRPPSVPVLAPVPETEPDSESAEAALAA